MKILLRWLIDHVWLFYVACAIGVLVYLVRALAAQREQSLAMFTLEHETATARAVKAWAMVFLFVALSLLIFIGTRFVLASYPEYDPSFPLPTPTPRSGVSPPTPSATSTVSDLMTMPTLGAETATPATPMTSPPNPTAPPTSAPSPTPSPTPPATAVGEGPLSGSVSVQFGDFGALVGWELSSGQVTVGEPLILTLYWQGLEGNAPTNYTVFTHLISHDGELIAQHDSPPAGGTRNTTEWSAGETVKDTHQLSFRSGAAEHTGPASIVVGLYDPQNVGDRVMTGEGQDRAVLPVTVSVIPR